MTRLLEHWEGVILSGDYTLEQRLGGDESAEFFQTSIAPDGRRAIIKLVPEAVVNGPEHFDLWHRTRELRHPNLIELIDYGRADLGGEIVVYAVFEDHDDSLASALRRAPLNPSESREVLDSVLQALQYLHAQALVIGALTPDNIVAVGDQVKLWTDTLREAAGPADYLNDVRLLGELWQDALMTASPMSSEIVGRAADPNPEARWTLAEISAALNSPSPTAPQPTPIPVPASIGAELGSEPPISVPAVSESSIIVRDDAPARTQSDRFTSERASSNRLLIWTFVGAATVLFFILFVNRSRLADFSITPGAAVSAPVEAMPVPVPRPVEPKVTRPALSNPPQATSAKIWRVIAFTYRSRDAAAKKAQQLNKDNPGLEAGVFSPNEKSGYYLVSVGGRMTHEEAVSLQRSTRGKGLPRDLYVQNYSR